MIITHPDLTRFLSNNEQWAKDVLKDDSGFFANGMKGQAPKVLWIGCADSRVPESVIMACRPGEIFVHRNIANQFHLDDDSAQSVLTYAVEELGVEHVVVVGHTICGGVAGAHKAACAVAHSKQAPTSTSTTPLERWLTPLVKLATEQDDFQPDMPPSKESLTALSEANVRAQVANIIQSDIIQNAWNAPPVPEEEKKSVYVHGWVYELETGLLRDLGVSRGPEGLVGEQFVGGAANMV